MSYYANYFCAGPQRDDVFLDGLGRYVVIGASGYHYLSPDFPDGISTPSPLVGPEPDHSVIRSTSGSCRARCCFVRDDGSEVTSLPRCQPGGTTMSDNYFTEADEDALAPLIFDEPDGYEVVGYWCWRGSGHLCDYPCKSDSVPLLAQKGWAKGVRSNVTEQVL